MNALQLFFFIPSCIIEHLSTAWKKLLLGRHLFQLIRWQMQGSLVLADEKQKIIKDGVNRSLEHEDGPSSIPSSGQSVDNKFEMSTFKNEAVFLRTNFDFFLGWLGLNTKAVDSAPILNGYIEKVKKPLGGGGPTSIRGIACHSRSMVRCRESRAGSGKSGSKWWVDGGIVGWVRQFIRWLTCFL